jgi:hypothetical protein
VAHLDRVAEREAVLAGRQQRQEGADLVRIEPLGRGQLPVDRPELVAELGSSVKPWPQNRPIASAASPSTLRLVQKREPLIANLKPSGTAFAQRA